MKFKVSAWMAAAEVLYAANGFELTGRWDFALGMIIGLLILTLSLWKCGAFDTYLGKETEDPDDIKDEQGETADTGNIDDLKKRVS